MHTSGLRRAFAHLQRTAFCLLGVACLGCGWLAAEPTGTKGEELRIFFIDVEGGQSTLFVTPEQSLLIDTGWPGNAGRDAERIAVAAKSAGISRIDYVLLTHYHIDHTGGVPQLVARIPVGTFIDHGPRNQEPNDKATEASFEGYQKVLATGKYGHIVAQPGEQLPVKGMSVHVLTADGRLIGQALPGAGQPNPYCKVSETRPPDQTENSRSVGVLITFGKLRILDLGDLTWDKEMDMMCPDNRIGHVDVLVVSHHGWYQSSSPALVDAIRPRVAIMDNGATKGGSKPTIETIRKIPGLETLWQLHYSEEAGPDNTPAPYIANLHGPDNGNGLELTAAANGSFSVINPRTGQTREYGPSAAAASMTPVSRR